MTDDVTLRFGSGRAVRRIEDDTLLTGQGRYADDVLPQAPVSEPFAVCFVRSPYPHARIASVDMQAARQMPGVLAVHDGEELAACGVRPMPRPTGFARPDGSPVGTPTRWLLARDRVRFVGEPVAVVVARTQPQAQDAAEAVEVGYEELPVVVRLQDAADPGARPHCEEAPDNVAAQLRHGDAQAAQLAFARARHVVQLHLVNQRLASLTLEPRSVLAFVEPSDGRLTVQMSTQMPSGVKASLGELLGIPLERIRVRVGDVGGGFGMKSAAHPEELITAWCAWRHGCAVKWVAERAEEFLSAATGRDTESQVEMALDEQGRVLALRIRALANTGGYAGRYAVALPLMIGPWVQTGVYDISTIDFQFRALLTNTAPVGAYRGAGRPEAIYIIERMMDEAARVVGIDRIELRRRNFVRPQQMPYRNAMGMVYDSGRFESIMDQALALADWEGFAQREASSRHDGRWRGLGIATFIEWTGGNVFEEQVTLTVLAEGVIEVFAAVNGMGQGIATSLAQLAVDEFQVPLSRIRVVLGDTDRGEGFGSGGSRSAFAGGSAVQVGARRTLARARELASDLLEADAGDLHYEAGRFTVVGTDLGVDLFELASRQEGERIHLVSRSAVSGPSWPNGCHICEVELSPETGEIAVVRYTSVNDVGRVINPMIVTGQLDGGALQGIGQALVEGVAYGTESGQLLTGSLMDYAAPRADLAPPFVTRMDESIPCLNNPLGVKGVGELGTIGATPCVVNAVADALARNGRSDLSPLLQMPLTPARVWALLHNPL